MKTLTRPLNSKIQRRDETDLNASPSIFETPEFFKFPKTNAYGPCFPIYLQELALDRRRNLVVLYTKNGPFLSLFLSRVEIDNYFQNEMSNNRYLNKLDW